MNQLRYPPGRGGPSSEVRYPPGRGPSPARTRPTVAERYPPGRGPTPTQPLGALARYFPFNRGASVSRPDLDFGRAITSGLGLNFTSRAEADRYAGNIELKRLDVTGRPVQGPQLVAADLEGQTDAITAEFGGGDFAAPFLPSSGGDGISPVVLIALVGGAAFLGYTLLAK